MSKKILHLVAITLLLLASGCIDSANLGIPEKYYLNLKPADIDSPIELIRFATSIQPYTSDFTVSERVAFVEWYLKNRGFNVSFAYSNNFRNSGVDHIWLVLKNKIGENMAIEPSYIEMKAESISPTTSDYKNYQMKFADIYELSKNTGGSDKYAWWKKGSGQNILNENIMLYKKSQL